MGLKIGVARGDITPDLPIDLVGYSRRAQHVEEVRRLLLATVLILDDGLSRLAIVAMDILALDHKSSANDLDKEVQQNTTTSSPPPFTL